MTRKATLSLGRINANEDEAKLVQMSFKVGEAFSKDDLLLTVETSKAAVEILAPSNGRILAVFVDEGETLQVGDVVFEAEFEDNSSFESLVLLQPGGGAKDNGRGARVGERKVSFKAERLASRLGLDVAKIPAAGSALKEADVTAYFDTIGRSQPMQCILVGAGRHAKSLIPLIRQAGYTISGVTDTKLSKGSFFAGAYPVLGTNEDFEQIYAAGIRTAFIGVGGATNNSVRKEIFTMLKTVGFVLPPLVSRDAFFDCSSRVGEATYVFPAASVGAGCVIGVNCILNQGSITCHDCKVGDHVHLSPGAILAGACVIGENTTIGMAATVLNEVAIGRDCLIHNNVPIARNIPPGRIVTLTGIREPEKHAT